MSSSCYHDEKKYTVHFATSSKRPCWALWSFFYIVDYIFYIVDYIQFFSLKFKFDVNSAPADLRFNLRRGAFCRHE